MILNAPAMMVLNGLDRISPFVARADLKRPWRAITMRAGLTGLRLHDLRHTYASFGAGGGLGWDCRLLGVCSAIPKYPPPRATRILITIRSDGLLRL